MPKNVSLPRRRVISAATALALTLGVGVGAALAGVPSASAAVGDTFRMTVEPSALRDSAGRVYEARTGFDKGDYSHSYWSPTDIRGTSDDALYYSELVRMNSWSRPFENGTYRVNLKMRECWFNSPGQRVFSVAAEGSPKLTDVDIIAAVGKGAAYDRSFDVTVKDGRLDLAFTAKKDSITLSALEVTRIADATPDPEPTTPAPTTPSSAVIARMSAAPTTLKDSAGTTYEARSGFSGGWYAGDVYSDGRDIKGTNDDALYRPEYVHPNSWSRAVPNGTYDVTLKMREGYYSAAGRRVFSVSAEGAPKLSDIDIIKAVGKDTAYDRTFRTQVTDGRLDLGFTAKADGALVSALVVTRVDGSSTPDPDPTTPAPTPTTPEPTTPEPTTPPANGSVGKLSGLLFDSGMFPMHQAGEVAKWEQARGKKVDVLTVFPARASWGSLHGTWYMDGARIPSGFRGTLDVAMPLWPDNGNIGTASSGGYNGEWEKFGRTIAARYPDAYIRLGWEMNLPGWKHAAYPHQAEQWKQAYRQAVGAIRKGGPNLRIAWVVNEGAGQTGTQDAAMFYPGDAYVDFIGMDAYDWWPAYNTSANIALHRDKPYGWSHWMNFAKARGKKFVLPEWGVAPGNSNGGGDNPQFINFVYSFLKANAAHVQYESYFHESAGYIKSDLFAGRSPKASAEYRRWMPLLSKQ